MGIAPVHVPVRSSGERGLEGLFEKTESAVAIATPVAAGRIATRASVQHFGNVAGVKAEVAHQADNLLFDDNAFTDAGGDQRNDLIVLVGAWRNVAEKRAETIEQVSSLRRSLRRGLANFDVGG